MPLADLFASLPDQTFASFIRNQRAIIVNCLSGDGGRNVPNKRVVIGRLGPITTNRTQRKAQEFFGKVAGGDGPNAL